VPENRLVVVKLGEFSVMNVKREYDTVKADIVSFVAVSS
jgi:hypothetical protein